MTTSPEDYNKIRRILFCTANNPEKGFSAAFDYLDSTYKTKLGDKGYIGMKAELLFYKSYKKELKLTVAGDMGEHADFSGQIDHSQVRFDVTTNINYKAFEDYEPFIGDGIKYKIALFDQSNFQLLDVLDLKFRKCECGGFLIPFILLKDQNFGENGECKWTNDQLLFEICTSCQSYEGKEKWTHHFLYSPSEFIGGISGDYNKEKIDKLIQNYYINTYKYFRREFRDDIMVVAEAQYKITGRKGNGYWAFDFGFINKVVKDDFPIDVPIDFSMVFE